MSGGRPSTYNDDVAAEICDRLRCGESLKAIVRDEHMPAERTVYQWLRANEAFAQQYARAREDQADADADAIATIAVDVLAERVRPDAGRVAIDALKWSAGKRKPKVYGDKVDLTHDVGGSLASILAGLGAGANTPVEE